MKTALQTQGGFLICNFVMDPRIKLFHMALIRLSALATDIIGKMNGSVFQRNQGGLSIRTQPGIINTRTPAQQKIKLGILACQNAWRGLNAGQINVWTAYAIMLNKAQKKNVGRAISGQALFLFQNTLRFMANEYIDDIVPVIITDPVLQLNPVGSTVLSVQYNGGSTLINFDSTVPAEQFVILKMSRPLTASQMSQYNKLAVIPANIDGGSSGWSILSEYKHIYGRVPNVDEYVNIEVTNGIHESNGFSPAIRSRLQVIA